MPSIKEGRYKVKLYVFVTFKEKKIIVLAKFR